MPTPFDQLVEIMAILRGPGGCPWDHEQTHKSIAPQLIEECHEVLDAIENENNPHLCEELGDLLLHVLFHAQIASDEKTFDIHDVINEISAKLVRRHPHVFGNTKVSGADQVVTNWDKIKAGENKKHKGESYLDSAPKSLPALFQAFKLTKKASKVGFDWKKTGEVLLKIDEEIGELKEALKRKKQNELEHEVGDLFFALANLCRFLKIQPEEALQKANRRFRGRFWEMEKKIRKKKKKMEKLSAAEWDRLWNEAKKKTKIPPPLRGGGKGAGDDRVHPLPNPPPSRGRG
ncbi:MAG: nucleoside triphosphate pyrophosphohydrolase [Deltaproteobacteria bacterium]|nr:nucleoside triphosphate pyrophosphohydrolase [Deltaproteobacteria bacterium]